MPNIHLNVLISLFCRRKSMTGNWKTNQGSAMLEQLPITEKYKSWIDEVSERFIWKFYLLFSKDTIYGSNFFSNNIIESLAKFSFLMREKHLLTEINLN
jgi:hypothetical protein